MDLLKHIWLPFLVSAITGTASLFKTFRANLIDELSKPYVKTARAKGVPYRKLLIKYPVRIALIPFVSTVGWMLPGLISGSTVVGIVMNLPTVGPLLTNALKDQDMYLAGSIVLILGALSMIGTVLSGHRSAHSQFDVERGCEYAGTEDFPQRAQAPRKGNGAESAPQG